MAFDCQVHEIRDGVCATCGWPAAVILLAMERAPRRSAMLPPEDER